jgi:hypothetical protein
MTAVPIGECLGDDAANWYRGGSTAKPSASASASVSGSPSALPSASGNGTVPSGTRPSVVPSHSGKPTYPSSGAQPGKPCKGGDTEPGHGPDAGRGALPGHKGEGDKIPAGWTGGYSATNGTSAGSAGTTGAAAQPSSVYTGPMSNNANALTGSILALGAAAVVALFL